MSLHFTDSEITSTVTEHRACRTDDGWEVTRFSGRLFDRNDAITAITIAEVYAVDPPPWDPIWVHVMSWENEIGIGW